MLITTWTPTNAALNALFAKHQKSLINKIIARKDTQKNLIEVLEEYRPFNILYAENAVPHTDTDGFKYSALLVLQGQHEINVVNSSKFFTRPPRRPKEFVRAQPGNIIFLDVSKTHWMPKTKELFIAAFIDLDIFLEEFGYAWIENDFAAIFNNYEINIGAI